MPNYVSQEVALNLLPASNRVLVIGCSGGGKSTLSQKLATRLNFPYQSIDRDVRWLPGWKPRPREEQRAKLRELVQQPRWIQDGSGASTLDIRLPRAELILWVRVPRYVCFIGVARRVRRHYGRVRPLMAPGCLEPFPDAEFLSYIWNFNRVHAPKFLSQIDKFGPSVPVCVLNTRGEMNRLLSEV